MHWDTVRLVGGRGKVDISAGTWECWPQYASPLVSDAFENGPATFASGSPVPLPLYFRDSNFFVSLTD